MKNLVKNIWSSKQPLGKYFIIFIVLLVITLDKMGYIESIKTLLDSDIVSIHFGAIRLSVYSVSRALFILLCIIYIASLTSAFIETKVRSLKILEQGSRTLLTKMSQMAIYFIFGMIALHFIGIDITALAVFSGAIGIGIGIGLQKIASNFISGIILLFERSIKEGDIIETSTGITGTVIQIASRYVLVEFFDGKEVLIPNEDFITSRVINWTFSHNKIRSETIIPLHYETDVAKALQIALAVARNIPSVIKDPEPTCEIKNFDDGFVNLRLRFWVGDIKQGIGFTRNEVLLAIWKEFRKNKIKLVQLDYISKA